MKKIKRLSKNEDFQTVYKKGRSMANRQFVVYVLKGKNKEYSRVGLSVSKKMGNAVVRNKIKRYIREVLKDIEDKLQLGNDYIIISRRPVVDMDYHQAKSSLVHVLKKAKVFHERKG